MCKDRNSRRRLAGEETQMRFVAAAASCLFAALWQPGLAISQDHDHGGGELGEVHFPVSCTPAAQQRFNVAASLLYSFYWEKIDAAVQDVLAADPACAMAYWLEAVASLENALGSPPTPSQQQQGAAAAAKASALRAKSERERDYIAAVAVLYKDYETVPFQTRVLAYEKALEQVHLRYPQDSEAAVLYAYWLQVAADRNDQTYARQLRSAEILEKVFTAQPDHPGAAHFLIHAYDFPPIAARGLDAARRYASIAPDSPHALHMPSHIFSRLGYWRESIATNVRSRAAATQDRDAWHALDYMTYAALQLGLDGEARQWVEFVMSTPKLNEETRQIAYAGAAIPARYALERGDWRSAARLALHPAPAVFNWAPFPEGVAVNAYARGLGAARAGDARAAKAEVLRLGELRNAMTTQKKDYWVEQAGIQIDAIEAWIARAEGRDEDAVRLMRAAADREDKTEEHIMMPGRVIPVREMLGELLLELDQPSLALTAFEQSQLTDPNRFRNVYGAARAAELAGDRAKARTHYARLLQQVDANSAARNEIAQARAFLQKS
jgi:hypothetical protein